MFVIHEPINTSSILSPQTSDSVLISSGSLGHAKSGSFISFKSISIISAYSASLSGSNRTGFLIHSSIAWALLSIVFSSPYPLAIIHLSIIIFDSRYSIIGSLLRRTVQPDADLSAEASDNSKACSTFKLGNPSISRHLPENTFFLPSFSTVSNPF